MLDFKGYSKGRKLQKTQIQHTEKMEKGEQI